MQYGALMAAFAYYSQMFILIKNFESDMAKLNHR